MQILNAAERSLAIKVIMLVENSISSFRSTKNFLDQHQHSIYIAFDAKVHIASQNNVVQCSCVQLYVERRSRKRGTNYEASNLHRLK